MGTELNTPSGRERLLTPAFALICGITLVTFFAFFLLLPTIPIYISSLGGDETQVGLAVGVLTVSSVVTRLITGQQSDRKGKKYFVLGGLIVAMGSSLLYRFSTSLLPLDVLRFAHGIGWGATTTAGAAIVADLAPLSRRGEAMGYYGLFSNASLAVAPAMAGWVLASQGPSLVFVIAAGLNLVAVVATVPMREPGRVMLAGATASASAVFSRGALFPSFVVLLMGTSYASLVSFVPLFALDRNLGNAGLFFTVYAIVMLVTRPWAGQLSDRYGRAVVVTPSLVAMCIALWLLSITWGPLLLVVAAAIYGVGFGASQPALMALAVDRARADERGAAMGTFTAAFDLGIGIGSVALGAVAQAAGYGTMYIVAGGLALITLGVFSTPWHLARRRA